MLSQLSLASVMGPAVRQWDGPTCGVRSRPATKRLNLGGAPAALEPAHTGPAAVAPAGLGACYWVVIVTMDGGHRYLALHWLVWGRRPMPVCDRWGALGEEEILDEDDGEMLFHLALRAASVTDSRVRDRVIAEIAGNGSPRAAEVALVAASHRLAAHPDDELLRRAVLVLDESTRSLAKSG